MLGQFVTRFLLRETSTQLQSLQSSLDCATEAVHDQGCTGRRTPKKPEELPIQRAAKRPSRRNQKSMCLSPTDPYSGMLTTGRGPAEVRCGRDEDPRSMTVVCPVSRVRGQRGARQPLGLPDQPTGAAH